MQPIVARYTRDDKEYSVVVAGYGKELKGAAPDIVAARTLADGLVEKIAAEPPRESIVVHLLDNSAFEFTRAYLDARLSRHQPDKRTDAPQSGKASARGQRELPKQEPEPTDATRVDPTTSAIIEEQSTDGTKNDTAEDTGASPS